jgi:hypothetical protein
LTTKDYSKAAVNCKALRTLIPNAVSTRTPPP